MKDEIRDFLLTHFPPPEDGKLSFDQSLLEAGVIDSVAMVDLIAYLERTYNIVVDEDDMVPENFDSINAIAAYVDGKRAGG